MNNLKKLKVVLPAVIVALILAISILISALPMSAFAARAATPKTPTVSVTGVQNNAAAKDIEVPSTVDFGKEVTLTGSPIVTAPNGSPVTLTSGKFTANQLGVYTVKYSSYTYDIYCSLDEEYIFKVDHNGADIPTYAASNTKITLPNAGVYYYDDNNIMHPYPNASAISYSVTDSLGTTGLTLGGEYTFTQTGKTFIYYTANLSNGKYFTQTFEVNVQASFRDNSVPVLSGLTGVPLTAAVNKLVTLPTASATDDFDTNIKIDIKVLDPDGNEVKNVDIDDNGFAYQKEGTTYDNVKFDNDKVMSFYPLKEGVYVVTYVATDDAGKTSSTQTFRITVSDSAGPIFVDIEDSAIPDTWGSVSVTNKKGAVNDKAGKITFPMPTLADNKDKSEDIKLYFRIVDTDRSKTILEYSNINVADSAETDSDEFKGNSTYGATDTVYKFNKDTPFTFDLGLYHRLVEDSTSEQTTDKSGTYTVTYRATDTNGSNTNKTYTIKIEENFTDDADPTITLDTTNYISVKDETFVIPTPEVADANSTDTRLKVDYKIYSDATSPMTSIDVKGNEEAEIVQEGSNYFLVIDEKRLQLGDNLYFVVTATDDAGNVASNIADTAKPNENNENTIKVVGTKTAAKASDVKVEADLFSGNPEIKAGESVTLGDFVLSDITLDMRYYTGFEVLVTDPDDNALSTNITTANVIDAGKVKIYINNITVTPGSEGAHKLTLRVFNVFGSSSIYEYTFTVNESDNNNADTSSAIAIPVNGEIKVQYTIKNEVIKNIPSTGDTYFVVRSIAGARYSLMGAEFIAYQQATYFFRDGYAKSGDIDGTLDYADGIDGSKKKITHHSSYELTTIDSTSPVLEVQGIMPSYSKKSISTAEVTVTLPTVVGISPNGNAKIDVEVKDPAGTIIDTVIDSNGRHTFKPTLDGAYTVAYTATISNVSPVTQTYTISVGDVVAPTFTVSEPASRMTVGDKFTFGSIVISDSADAVSATTITKSIIDPSGNTVSDATVTGSYTTYKDYKNNGTDITLSQSGTYTVEYKVVDSAGNSNIQKFTITVSASGTSTIEGMTTLSIVLIVVAIVLLAGVIIYVIRFRRVKK